MRKTVRRQKSTLHGGPVTTEEVRSSRSAEKSVELKEDLDALLDEVDEVLIKNAADFVNSYRQKGGQ